MSTVLMGILAFGFSNPSKIREANNYDFFYFVISVSFLILTPKFLLAASYLISLVLRLFKARYFSRILLMSSLIISLGLMINIGYGITFGRKTLRVIKQEIYLDSLPDALDKTTIVQISDIHLGGFKDDSFIRRAADEINSFHPDLILFTGDMVNNYYQEMLGFEDEFAAMKASFGKYAILGNHDYGDYSNWESKEQKQINHQTLEGMIEDAGFELLLNESAKIDINNESVEIIGVENWGHPPFPQYADLDMAMKNTEKQSFKILMTHDPAHWADRVIEKTDVPLSLSGHTHAAQSGIQFAGIEFSPMYFIQKYWGGLYKHGNQYLYVNRGIGCVGLLGRIEMAPEITVLTLRSK
ncbi:metallophosphoesterase [Sunxiuqinia indica]|uniref:metallophosphoesterase n=1 Tax=Sunxiuqinia indica TaxID=2692584 RepID=UPI001357790F|nr:metallophosphoesterase [Sunxiuqinia indica]